ncbi:MAG: EVE domain-containing protein [Chloroflexota bacterium]|nr:EVE domain-containing protein [Chloroflexota bacterium]
MAAWLVKTEPNEYSYADLERDGTAEWDGVTNALAQRHLRAMRPGDTCVVYHSGGERAVVGLASLAGEPYPDPTDPTGKRVWVDLRAEQRLARPIRLAELKADPTFAESPLVRMSRLSVMPLEPEQLSLIERLGRA